jgi:Lipid A 3-O-deacylase (PagL)
LNNQAANVAWQSILGAGFEFGRSKRLDLNLRFIHYSNGYSMIPNEGFNIFYVASLGYLF